ncbi:TetR/AcrR family transcriptional regulator [Tessaracoccus antarcticus]|uniref:TetR/AcrR family transcriptional regulator n=1 Tax=Tessaracoccus antarcticus TaxID=2479848 RepID=A0A3M0FWX0_9ACTN|nr:TetR/AcrR family transcriptional regulator [Tessaracoccus antarcticus]RMB57270.1 TetR/AcrR family transcriptional regulator [Tessaracoccus antarcticus]
MSVTKRTPRMRPETLRRRRDILRAATQVFGSKGYTNGTLGDIADLVGMTNAGILHHFGTKDHLLLEVLTYRDETDVEDLAEQHIPGGSEFFRHLIRTAFANAQRAGIVQTFAVLSGESVTDGHPAAQYFADRYATLRGEAQKAFHVMCAESGITEPDTLEHASAAILAVMDGLQVQWLHNPTDVRLAEATEFAIEAIVSSVLKPQESLLR